VSMSGRRCSSGRLFRRRQDHVGGGLSRRIALWDSYSGKWLQRPDQQLLGGYLPVTRFFATPGNSLTSSVVLTSMRLEVLRCAGMLNLDWTGTGHHRPYASIQHGRSDLLRRLRSRLIPGDHLIDRFHHQLSPAEAALCSAAGQAVTSLWKGRPAAFESDAYCTLALNPFSAVGGVLNKWRSLPTSSEACSTSRGSDVCSAGGHSRVPQDRGMVQGALPVRPVYSPWADLYDRRHRPSRGDPTSPLECQQGADP